ncbi:MAG: hypothetical protein Q8R08_03585 [bacterium]|nr:hypothetical protein [bacterium]
MTKSDLVLSNATTFFSGNIEKVFQKAKKYGFRFLEILPYRWTRTEEILNLEARYNIKVVGIHLPPGKPKNFLEKILNPFWVFYLGRAKQSPGWDIAQAFKRQKRDFYLLCHSDLIAELDNKLFSDLPIVIENIPYYGGKYPEVLWDPIQILQTHPQTKLVFDPGHFSSTPRAAKLLQIYPVLQPEAIHIGYNNFPPHLLPNQKEREELKMMLEIHRPRYIVLETNPLVSVKKGKKILDALIDQTANYSPKT